MNTTWAMNALRLQKDNTKLASLLEEALDCIDQYDYEEAFDLVHRIKDALKHSRMSHPPVVPWGGSSLTEMEELLQKVQKLERDKLKMLADLQVESEINAKGGEREYVLLGKVEQLQRENAELRRDVYQCPPSSEQSYEGLKWSDAFDVVERDNAELHNEVTALKRENAALREQIAALGEIAVLNYDDATVGKCDAITGGGEKYKDVMRRLFVDQPREIATLRSLLREAITDYVSPYDLPESEDYIARVKTALGEDKL